MLFQAFSNFPNVVVVSSFLFVLVDVIFFEAEWRLLHAVCFTWYKTLDGPL